MTRVPRALLPATCVILIPSTTPPAKFSRFPEPTLIPVPRHAPDVPRPLNSSGRNCELKMASANLLYERKKKNDYRICSINR